MFFDSHRRGLRVSIVGGVDEIHYPPNTTPRATLSGPLEPTVDNGHFVARPPGERAGVFLVGLGRVS